MTRPRAKRARPNADARNVVGEGRDRAVLEDIVWAGYLTTGQVATLHFPTRRRAQRRLRALLDHGLVEAHLQGDALQRETFFSPTSRARTWLEAREAFPHGVPRSLRLPRPQKLAHALGIRDVFVAFLRAEREGRFALDDFRFDGDLARDPTFAPLRLIPDGLASVRRGDAVFRAGVEYDRGTETTSTLRAKFEAWRSAFELGSAPPLRLLVVVCGARRTDSVRRLLAESGVSRWATAVEEGNTGELLTLGWPFEVAVPTDRTERPAPSPEVVLFRPVGAARSPAFGASPRVKL
ncbi:MAG: Replication-relaxation [Myxococcaceae bacterium]|nr:Replication-relaxation [Myxococcaceae bacterium]